MQITNKILEILNDMSVPQPPLQGLQHAACLQQAQSLQCLEPEPCCGWIRTVIYSDDYDTNVRIDRKPTPAALLYTLEGFEIGTKDGIRKDSVEVEVFFFDRCTFAAKGETTKTVMERVEPVVGEFVARVMSERSWVVDGDKIEVTAAVGKFDANVAGWSVQLKLTERQGRCLKPIGCECK